MVQQSLFLWVSPLTCVCVCVCMPVQRIVVNDDAFRTYFGAWF